jgi:hypothetical protein
VEIVERYWRWPDGSVGASVWESSQNGAEAPPPRAGAVEISAAEHDAGVAALAAARAEWVGGLVAEEAATALLDCTALILAGVPEATARRMSGCLDLEVEINV